MPCNGYIGWHTYEWKRRNIYLDRQFIILLNIMVPTVLWFPRCFFFFFFFIKYEDQKQLFLLWSKMDDRLEGCVDILGRSTGHPCEPIKLLGSSSWDDWQVMVHKAHQVMTKSFDQCRRSRMKPYYM